MARFTFQPFAKVAKMGSNTCDKLDYNGVGILRGQQQIFSNN